MISYVPRYEDSALFVGIVKGQTDKNIRTFFLNEFSNKDGLFKKYKKGLIKNSGSSIPILKEEINALKGFYEPEGYILFGDADLAVISQVDDFMFGGHLFHPTHPYKKDHEDARFYYDYQSITGFIPSLSLSSGSTFSQKWNNFLRADKKFPFIAITRIKINSPLIVGVGKKVNSLISILIKSIFNKANIDSTKCDFFLIESFCSHEFTLLSYSNSIKALTEIILSLREISLSTIIETIKTEFNSNIELLKIANDIEKESLLSFWLKNPEINSKNTKGGKRQLISQMRDLQICDSHIITMTQTTFGYHIDFYEKRKNFIEPKDISKIQFIINFNIKPGHLNSFRTQFEIIPDFKKYFSNSRLTSGNSLLSYYYKSDINYPIPPYSLFNFNDEHEPIPVFNPDSNLLLNLNAVCTSFTIKIKGKNKIGIDLKDIERHANKHLRVSEKLKDLTFKTKHLKDIRLYLKQIGISKVLQTRIQKMFGNYNDHIQDPALHVYFIDLVLYLKWIYKILHDIANEVGEQFSHSDVHISLNELINNFEKAFKNKHHQTYLEQNATDTNLEYSGGLHQIIGGYEAFYRVVQSGMNFDIEKNAIAYISGEPDVDSDAYAVRLNYYHLFNVQHFMGIILKEASNYYLPSNCKLFTKKELELNKRGIEVLKMLKKNEESYFNIKVIRDQLAKQIKFSYQTSDEMTQFLYNNVNHTLFQYVVSDFISYYYSCNSDFDLFVYTHLSLFLQNPNHYTKDRKIVDKELLHTLIRLNLVGLIHNEIKPASNYTSIIKGYLSSINLVSQELNIQKNELVSGFTKTLYQIEDFKSWIKDLEEEFMHLFINESTGKKIDALSRIEMLANQGKSNIEIKELLQNEFTFELQKNITTYKRIFNREIAKNNYVEFKDDYSAFVLAIINSVLRQLKDKNHGKLKIMYRDGNGNPEFSFSPEDSSLLLNDPFGGVFIRRHVDRIDFFKFRREVLHTMMDFSLKMKMELYKTRLDIDKTKKVPNYGELF